MLPSTVWLFLILLQHTSCAPLPKTRSSVSPLTELKPRAALAPPYFVIYGDKADGFQGPPPATKLAGYNVYALSFFQSTGAVDKAAQWAGLADADRQRIKSEYAAAGIKIIVSLFGSTDAHPSSGRYANNAGTIEFAETVTNWVQRYSLDGVDIDYEDNDAFNQGTAVDWLISLTQELRKRLPDGIITHAPQAPWFSPARKKGYLDIHKAVGDQISAYLVQFYNQGQTAYTTCENLLTDSGDATALFQIAQKIPQSKLIIGKPATPQNAYSGGYIEPGQLAQCIKQARESNWDGGVMVWEFPDADSRWIQTVRGSTFPESSHISRRDKKGMEREA